MARPITIGRAVVRWFGRTGRDLPWRRDLSPYRVWVSEIMLQQTRVAAVIPYYERFLKRFPSVRKLARARRDNVLKAWEGLGYYARARNLHEAARVILEEHRGHFPETADEWETLPGVGEYTGAAIASITDGDPVPVLDANAKRVASRLLMKEKKLEEFLGQAVLTVDPGDFNQGIMELGQVVCTPRSPKCSKCPLKAHCRARKAKAVHRFPRKRKRRKVPHHEVAVGVCMRGRKFLV
ncbi:MAG: A/G-specific adenine glycosylase, partial [Planctomycetota bacterium]